MGSIKVFDDCVYELSRLPGIGRKTASRLALHILKMDRDKVAKLSESFLNLKDKTVFCSKCGGISETEVCGICSDSSRNNGEICVIEEARDIFVLEGAGCYRGRYHVLGGKISPIDGVGPEDLRIDELEKRIKEEGVTEVILATNPDIDGETTAVYLSRILSRFPELNISRIASGIPIGAHLEHADEITLLRAMEGRRKY